MKFIDEVTITVQSGDGGSGCVSFRREKFIPRGGPDGGDGGKGGDVIIQTTPRRRTLYHLRFNQHFRAKNGSGGQGNQRTGKGGHDLVIEVPPGTSVKDAESGEMLADLTLPDQIFVPARGGRGGLGNKHFATSTHRTPRFAQPGEPGQTVRLQIELKLLADVGIIGLPNAGKSSLISVISSAHPKIADYPFTTLTPNLGVVKPASGEAFTVADIPGLIEGAHQGAGLGIRFLRHIERTRLLLHLIDAAAIDPQDPLSAFRTVNRELAMYSAALVDKPQVVVLNKIDLPEAAAGVQAFRAAIAEMTVEEISAATGKGLRELLLLVARMLEKLDGQQP